MLTASLCLQLALHVTACEQALNALDAQYKLLEPARVIEHSMRIGLEKRIGKRGVDGITLFLGPAIDWQTNSRIYLSIKGDF